MTRVRGQITFARGQLTHSEDQITHCEGQITHSGVKMIHFGGKMIHFGHHLAAVFVHMIAAMIICHMTVCGVTPTNGAFVYNTTACKEPCRNGTFELMPCDKEHPKLCKGKSLAFLTCLACHIAYIIQTKIPQNVARIIFHIRKQTI